MWPAKADLFGVKTSVTTYADVVARTVYAAQHNVAGVLIDFMAVHLLVEAARNKELADKLNQFDVVAPDGQPVRWALNRFHGAALKDRVYGPETMLRVCAVAAQEGIPIFLYGSTSHVLEKLCGRLKDLYPFLNIAGAEPSLFRPLSAEEDVALVQQINGSGARIVFVGLGAPRQEAFAFEHRARISAVQMCVGAAFDFHAGNKPMAPRWMQDRGLEWAFRLWSEPFRLWKRYLFTNTAFVSLFLREQLRRRRG